MSSIEFGFYRRHDCLERQWTVDYWTDIYFDFPDKTLLSFTYLKYRYGINSETLILAWRQSSAHQSCVVVYFSNVFTGSMSNTVPALPWLLRGSVLVYWSWSEARFVVCGNRYSVKRFGSRIVTPLAIARARSTVILCNTSYWIIHAYLNMD